MSISARASIRFAVPSLLLAYAFTGGQLFGTGGALDVSFGSGGIVTTDLGGSERAVSLAIQPDGKIVVLALGNTGPVILRYLADGNLDTFFGAGGSTILPHNLWYPVDIRLQSAGKIVVAFGSERIPSNWDFGVTRLNADGSIDGGFGSSGTTITSVGGSYDSFPASMVIQADDKVLIGGDAYRNGTGGGDFAVVRYTQDGHLDLSFNGSGMFRCALGGKYDAVQSLALQPDGKIVAAGYSGQGHMAWDTSLANNDFAVLRLSPDGVLDATFGRQGFAIRPIDSSYNEKAFSVAVAPNGTLLLAGNSEFSQYVPSRIAVTRLSGSGASQALRSVFPVLLSGEACGNASVRFQPDGKFLLATSSPVKLRRFSWSGAPDASFDAGVLAANPCHTYYSGRIFEIQADGRIVVIGGTTNQGGSDIKLMRLERGPLAAPEIEVEQPVGVSISSAGPPISLGNSAVGGSTLPVSFLIKNTGAGLLDSLSITLLGDHPEDFQVTTAEVGDPLDQNQSSSFTVRFAPTQLGIRSSTLQIASSDSDENPFLISLTGVGITASSGYANWASSMSLTGSEADSMAAPHGDGTANLLKYAFNLDGTRSDSRTLAPYYGTAGLPSVDAHKILDFGGIKFYYWQIQFIRQPASGMRYTVLRSSSLQAGSWMPVDSTAASVEPIDSNWERVTFMELFDPASSPRLYFRVEVTLP